MKRQQNKQRVNFFVANQCFSNEIDLKVVYNHIHGDHNGYGTSANILVKEMLCNLLDLAYQGYIHLDKPFVITDYGCGQSKASNILAMVISRTSNEITELLYNGASYGEILDFLEPYIKEADSIKLASIEQIVKYGHITVQRYDIGVPAFAKKLSNKADVVFCNDVFEHIPIEDLEAFINDLKNSGTYIAASISLRDAVNYSKLTENYLLSGAQKVDEPNGIVLTQEQSGCYIFSLHVSILSPAEWQKILGNDWFLLSAQDYTACSALNYRPSPNYQQYKKELISKVGFADFIPFPTVLGSKYEKDPILFRRTAMMQPEKHVQKLNVLLEYPDNPFKTKERNESEAVLTFLGAKLKKEKDTYVIEHLPDNWLNKLYALEALSKLKANTNAEVWKNSQEIIAQYNSGNTTEVDNYMNNM